MNSNSHSIQNIKLPGLPVREHSMTQCHMDQLATFAQLSDLFQFCFGEPLTLKVTFIFVYCYTEQYKLGLQTLHMLSLNSWKMFPSPRDDKT